LPLRLPGRAQRGSVPASGGSPAARENGMRRSHRVIGLPSRKHSRTQPVPMNERCQQFRRRQFPWSGPWTEDQGIPIDLFRPLCPCPRPDTAHNCAPSGRLALAWMCSSGIDGGDRSAGVLPRGGHHACLFFSSGGCARQRGRRRRGSQNYANRGVARAARAVSRRRSSAATGRARTAPR
jgi:hypothetical protein